MSFRGGPQDVFQLIRSIEDRLALLERNGPRTKQNTVRLGNWVIEADGDKKLKMTNLDTGIVTYVGSQSIPFVNSKEWSYAGTVAPSVDVHAPKLACPYNLTLTNVTIQLQTASSTDYTVTTYVDGGPVDIHTLLAGQITALKPISIDIYPGQTLYPVLSSNPSATGTELSITYWYTGIYTGDL